MTTKGCLIAVFVVVNVILWSAAAIVADLANSVVVTALLQLLSALEVLLVLVGILLYMVVNMSRELFAFMAPIHFVFFSVWGPAVGVGANLHYLHADPQRDFYAVVAGVGATLLIAFSIDAVLPSTLPTITARMRRGMMVGAATGVATAIVAPLIALARVCGGTQVLCGLALGGLLMGVLMIFVSLALRSAGEAT